MHNNDTRRLNVQLISDAEKYVFTLVNFVIISAAISLLGLVANAMNIVVFTKQGFQSTMNITFFSLAISDMCSLFFCLVVCICVNPLFIKAGIKIEQLEIAHLTGGVPHVCFARITGWITVYATAERCLCIIFPLKIKQIITPKVTMATILFIYVSIMLSFLPEYEVAYIDWKFVAERNRPLLGMVARKDMEGKEDIMYVVNSILGFVSFVAVIVLTLVLVDQLKQKTKWRKTATGDQRGSRSISNRDKKSMNMVVLIATVLIVCYSPGVLVSMTTFFVQDFDTTGQQSNMYFSVWSFVITFDVINSSVNIFLYYNMSTKYRETFNQVFGIFKGDDSKEGKKNLKVKRKKNNMNTTVD